MAYAGRNSRKVIIAQQSGEGILMKKIISAVICLVMMLSAVSTAFAASDARLYNVYADSMLFQRDTDAILAGEAPDGGEILAQLFDSAGSLVTYGKATASEGKFSVSFYSPAGSYDTYTVKVSCNGAVFAELEDVVFGELWLASGQSNMEYPLYVTPEGKEMVSAQETGPHDIHVMYMPPQQKDGVYQTRYLPQTDAFICSWFTADDPQVYNMSAPAYFFAVRLQKQLDMPVGVLSVPLGGSAIAPWLSREAIDGSPSVKQHLTDNNEYYEEEHWNSSDCAMHLDMTNLYNSNIAPLINFRPQGAIWYQGCSDLFLNHSAEYYRDCFDLMQDSYTADFGYTGGRMPFILSQIACYDYGQGPFRVTAFNEVFTELAKADPSSRGEVTIYDLSLDFNEWGSIHPMTKKPIGERMFLLAESLVYGKKSPTSAPYCKKTEIGDNGIYLTFENVGSGLQFVGDTPRGFAICGIDGVAIEADAEIVSNDTVRVFSEFVEKPVAATYAAGSWSERANLWSFYGGEPFMPAAPVGISDPAVIHHFADNAWMNCEDMNFFESGVNTGYIETWKTSGCSVCLETEDKAEGDGSLRISSLSPLFSLSPNISDKDGMKTVVFDNVDADWSDYGALRLQVKNCGKAPVRLNEIRLYTNEVGYYTPVCVETGLTGVTVPADGEWHKFTFDLDRLLLMGAGCEKGNDKLKEVRRVSFRWEGANAELLLDDIRVLPETDAQSGSVKTLEDVIAYLKALFAAFRDIMQAFFGIASCA